MDNNEIDFVVRHYRENCFRTDKGWGRLGIRGVSHYKKIRAAAAIVIGAVLTASAAILYREYWADGVRVDNTPTEITNSLTIVKVIDFEDASLPIVINKIEEVYGVEVDNLPESPEDYTLSLHYEGTPTDLIQTINEILGTQITVNER